MLQVRRARVEDAHAIARVYVETWQATYRGIVPQDFLDALNIQERADGWMRMLDECDSSIFVAEADGELCGFVSGGPLKDGVFVDALGYDAEIYVLYVLPRSQGQGAGRLLMKALAAELAAQGLRRPVVWALEANPWRVFYERRGGRVVAQKTIEIGGEPLGDVAYGWDDLRLIQ